MKILLTSATIIDASSSHHLTTQDILIENGQILKIGNLADLPADKIMSGLYVSQGWFDSSVSFGEPGYEERETLENGLRTSALSGFTTVAVNPNTNPVADSHADIAFIKAQSKEHGVTLLPIGALTTGSQGEALAELYDMQKAGAIAFGDYKKSISNANLVKIALQYAQNFDGLVLSFPNDSKIAGKGIVNEHISSTKLGLKGIPALAEVLHVARELTILEYTGGKLHIPTISTSESIALISNAKAKGLDVSCSVAISNLFFDDEMLDGFDSHYKLMPPLRNKEQVAALRAAVLDSTIDMVTSDHNPLNIELKQVEFDHAAYGSIGLESAFGALNSLFGTEKTIEILTAGKKRFGCEVHPIEEGNQANLTLFLPEESYTFSEKDIHSTSLNSIFLGHTLKGKAQGIIAKNQLIIQ